MNGPQHYVAAERLLADKPTVRDWIDDPAEAREHWMDALDEAQVHATLALAAATALSTGNYAPKDTAAAWLDVAS